MALRALLVVAAVLALAACGGGGQRDAGSTAAASASDVRDLRSVDELRSAFTADRGHARLVLLISPT
ncbi:MAG TPA: hypothetical protein VJ689_08230 [Gaiellaceae bacterium]|jgi:hypothetical protein|nr:hypothetical protein [Gaiellaceae bacterium]